MERRSSLRPGRVALLAALALAAALAAAPGLAGTTGSPPAEATAPGVEVRVIHLPQAEVGAAAEPALQVVRDPESGELRAPTGAEAAELAKAGPHGALAFDGAGLQAVRLPSGATVLDLQGRLLTLETVTLGGDGTVTATCHETTRPAAAVEEE